MPFAALAGVTLVFFGDVLFSSSRTVLSKEGTDLYSQFIFYRNFGFRELSQGNLALWNPHIFSGVPFFGGFQTALLYPLNVLFLILPLDKAINVSIILHVFLAGVFMYLWTLHRSLHPLACLVSAFMLMFCGAHFLHIHAGHLPNLCTMIWAPLLFLAMDGLRDARSSNHVLGWSLLGIMAVTMQMLAGHPQYVFYTAVAAFIYAGFLMIRKGHRMRIMPGLLGIYLSASALGAVQLLTGIDAAAESVRNHGLSYEFAAMFSFPPENFLTLIAPEFFGNMTSLHYWGRCYLWEMSLFFSVTGLALCMWGVAYGDRNLRRFSGAMVVVLLILALGAHTPVFRVLYSLVPGFDKFRGSSKFIFFASIFLIMLSGIGLDHFIGKGRAHGKVIVLLPAAGLLLSGLAALVWYSATQGGVEGVWAQIMKAVSDTREGYLPAGRYEEWNFIRESGLFAARGLFIASVTCGILAVVLFLTRFSRKWAYLPALVAVAELMFFAREFRPTFELAQMRIPGLARLAEDCERDDRVWNLVAPNSAMSFDLNDIWGYDPGVLRRYAEFMTYTQGADPDSATQYVRFTRFHDLYKMLRCRYIVGADQGRIRIQELESTMPRLLFVDSYMMIPRRNRIFSQMSQPEFDPQKTVILESRPDPEPVQSAQRGVGRIVEESTDHMVIEADLDSPSILVITDAYSEGWRAQPLAGSVQAGYEIMPANYILRAIPLEAGHHHFRVEYAPPGFRIGRWVSLASLLFYGVAVVWWCVPRFRQFFHREGAT